MSEISKNKEAERMCGERPHGNALFEPHELGYACPICGASDEKTLCWSEYNCFIYCKNCNLDIPSCLCKKYPEPRLTDKPLTKRERVIENTKTFLKCLEFVKEKQAEVTEAKIDYFWHEGRKVPIKPAIIPVKLSIEEGMRVHTAWYEPLSMYGIGGTAEEAVEDLRSDMGVLYQHYYLGDRNNMKGEKVSDIISWFNEYIKNEEDSGR